jgi:ABC-type bacteriocin/lantibiotic exporter with double-glycine peptidase domain
MQIIKKLHYILSKRERKLSVLLLIGILLMAMIDMLGIASILPFIALISNPEIIDTNLFLKNIFSSLKIIGINTKEEFIFLVGGIVFLLLIFSLIFKALIMYFQTRFVKMCEYNISTNLLKYYLNQPYSWFLNRNSSQLAKSILSEVTNVIGRGLSPVINLITNIIIFIAIFVLLLMVNPKLTVISVVVISIFYSLIYSFNRNLMSKIGKIIFDSNEKKFKVINEAFQGSKEVKVGGLEQAYIDQYTKPANKIAINTALTEILFQIPRLSLEAITFGGMLLVVLYLMARSGNFINAVPIISIYAYAGYRLMPALQLIYVSITQLRFVDPALNILLEDLKDINEHNSQKNKDLISIKKYISLKDINYNYPNSSRTALKNVNFNIPACSTVAFVGATGSGKTTTVDIILGLLEPHYGSLEVDGQVIDKNNYRAWQKCIGYVPQQIFLADDTVAANIAFGLENRDIDLKAVENAAKIANLHNFVVNELPSQYQTHIGERGIRLSGGQRQRIGIARALYNNPKVLVFDEATSALDNLTEQAVMDAVYNLKKNITIILIAHRLSTVKKCDKIFFLENGQIIQSGSFDYLIENSKSFRESANII